MGTIESINRIRKGWWHRRTLRAKKIRRMPPKKKSKNNAKAAKASSPVAEPKHKLDREDFSDFSIIVANGQEVKCHKLMLAKSSPVFHAMMKDNFVEAHTNKMELKQFDQQTVESFLAYIYEDPELIPENDLYKKGSFDKKRLTTQLLRFSHMYDVKNLLLLCLGHLKKNVDDDNAIEVWTIADAIGNEELKDMALEYLVKKKDKMFEVPQLEESFHFQSPLMRSLFNYLNRPTININVNCYDEVYKNGKWSDGAVPKFTVRVDVKQSYTVKVLRALTDEGIPAVGYSSYRCRIGSFRHTDSASCFEEDQILQFYGLENESTVRCTVR